MIIFLYSQYLENQIKILKYVEIILDGKESCISNFHVNFHIIFEIMPNKLNQFNAYKIMSNVDFWFRK